METVALATSKETHSVRHLRRQRRERELCAQYGSTFNTYLCKTCKVNRDDSTNRRMSDRASRNLCLTCGRAKQAHEGVCNSCLIQEQLNYHNRPNRKLRAWERAVLRWLFQHSTPLKETVTKVASFFEMPLEELFPIFKVRSNQMKTEKQPPSFNVECGK